MPWGILYIVIILLRKNKKEKKKKEKVHISLKSKICSFLDVNSTSKTN